MRRIIAITVTASLGLGGFFGQETLVKAEQATNLPLGIENRTSDNEINNLQKELYNSQRKIEKLNKATLEIQTGIIEKNKQKEEAKKNIKKLQKKIDVITERMKARGDLLKERARSYQEAGGPISYMDVLLGSQSISDFIERAEAVAVIIGADRNILEEQKEDKESIEQSQSKIKSDLNLIDRNIADLKKAEGELTQKKQKLKDSIKVLREKEEAVEEKMYNLKDVRNKKTSLNNINQTSLASVSENGDQQISGNRSSFIWPTIGGVITTYQGMRWGSFHKGIDIARPSDYSILAVASGIVTYAGWINGYGNTIKLTHNNGYTTQYAHLATIKVRVGQNVSQGNEIGIMGSTGRSTGIHLDFEVYRNSKLLDPLDVLPRR